MNSERYSVNYSLYSVLLPFGARTANAGKGESVLNLHIYHHIIYILKKVHICTVAIKHWVIDSCERADGVQMVCRLKKRKRYL